MVSVFVLWFLIKPHPHTHPRAHGRFHFKEIRLTDLKRFTPAFWWLLFAMFFLMLARFSRHFVTLKAKDVGWTTALLPAIYIVTNLVHAAIAWPTGKWADRFSRTHMLFCGLLLMVASQLVLSLVTSVTGVIGGVILLRTSLGHDARFT